MAHDVGDVVRLWAAFFDEAGAQTAPTTVTLIVRDPADVDTTISNEAAVSGDVTLAAAATGSTLADETGVYKAVVETSGALPGVWRYEWEGAGIVDEVQSGWFEVRPRKVADPA